MLTSLSSVRFPKSLRRVVNPVPPAVTVWVEPAAPKIRSFAFVVVAEPLFMAAPEPAVAAATSTGLVGSMPEYSWM